MKLKKILAATLAATMVMSSAITVSAGYYDSSESSSTTTTSIPEYVQAANAPVAVAGSTVTTTIAGGYAAKSVQGMAVTTPLAEVKANLGLKNGQVPAITIYDTDPAKSPAALACINATLDAMGLSEDAVVATLNIDLYAKSGATYVALADGSVAMVTGLPKNADTTKTYSVICVQPGGVVTVFEDLDTNPKTVTFEVQAGIGTYALVAE